MEKVNLENILKLHGMWLKGEKGGKKANLQEADLENADLANANLREANLQNANLREANLQNANLFKANLREANLREANLQNANLFKANLENADLANAHLFKADLREANNVITVDAGYKYPSHAFIVGGMKYIQLGCFCRTAAEWDEDFNNNPHEFPAGSKELAHRKNVYEFLKKHLEIQGGKNDL